MNDVRLIDANALSGKEEILYQHTASGKIVPWAAVRVCAINNAPTIDAVHVVRCKECKKRKDPRECPMCFTEVEEIEGGRMYKFTDLTRPDGFCHMGAKMDGGEDCDQDTV